MLPVITQVINLTFKMLAVIIKNIDYQGDQTVKGRSFSVPY